MKERQRERGTRLQFGVQNWKREDGREYGHREREPFLELRHSRHSKSGYLGEM